MDLIPRNNPNMDIATVIAGNLTAWMSNTPALDTLMKVSARSGIGFGTVQRAKNGDGNITAKSITAIAESFGRTAAELMTPPTTADDQAGPHRAEMPAAETVESLARLIAEQSAEVARRWIALPPDRREALLTALRAESREIANPGEGRTLPTPKRKPRPATATPPDTEERQAGD